MDTLADPMIALMVSAVRAAGRACRAVQADLVTAEAVEKGDRSPVTVADFAAQAIVARRLAGRFPGIPLVAEEDSDLLRREENAPVLARVLRIVRGDWPEAAEAEVLEAIDRGEAPCDGTGRFFTLDPIDGTKGFLRGDQYAVALALLEEGRVAAGVLACPNLPAPGGGRGLVYCAAAGRGTMRLPLDGEGTGGEPVRVSPEADPTRIRFCESVEKAHSHKGRSARVAEALGVTAAPVRIDSQAKYALVASGEAELYLRIPRDDRYREKIWDHAAGSLLVEEAGGRVTDIHGKPLDFRRGRTLAGNRGVVAGNGLLHAPVLAALARVLREEGS